MKLPWEFQEPMGQWRSSKKLLNPGPSRWVILKAWWHSRRYLGMFEAWSFVNQFAMEGAR